MIYNKMINELFSMKYKALFALLLCLLIAFSNRIEVLKDGAVAYIILILALVMLKEDLGIVLLLSALFVLTYNNVAMKVNGKVKRS